MIRMFLQSMILGACPVSLLAATLGLTVNHTFSGKPLAIGQAKYSLASGEHVVFSRLSYLLSGFELQREDGSWLVLDNQVAWMDAAIGRSKVQFASVPEGRYRSLRFSVGLPMVDNVREVTAYEPNHPLNPQLNKLHWSWQTGYIFLAVEGHLEGDTGFSYHLARSPNRTWIHLGFDVDARGRKMLVTDFDLATLFNAPQIVSIGKDGVSTHSREGDPLAAKLKQNLPGAFQLRQVIDLSPLSLVKSGKPPLYLPEKHTPVSLYYNRRLPMPALPEDNPLTRERIALGKALFHDARLSANNEMSCATCHLREHAFTDPRKFSVGIDGSVGVRNAMPLYNLAWKKHFFWDGRVETLRKQALMPIEDPIEMADDLEMVVEDLSADASMTAAFAQAFSPPEITAEKIGLAIEQFLISQVSYRSRYDRAIEGRVQLTEQEQRGFHLFVTEHEPRSGQFGADCFHCHGGTLFTDHQFHNNGLVPGMDEGRSRVTGKKEDRFKFVTPSLRNVAVTAPYMHDGQFATLEEVIEHYDRGLHRSPSLDPNLAKREALNLSAKDKAALVAFLKTLTDEYFLRSEP